MTKTKNQLTAEMREMVLKIAARRKIDLPNEVRDHIVRCSLIAMITGYASSTVERRASKLMTTYKLVAGF